MFSTSLPALYCACLLAIQVSSNVIRSPSQSSLLTFQVEPNNVHDESFETWPADDGLQSHHHRSSDKLGGTLNPPPSLFNWPVPPPSALYNPFATISGRLPFFTAFQNALSRFMSVAIANGNLHHHHHLPEPIDCSKYTIGEVLEWTLSHTPKPSSGSDDSGHPPPLHRLAWLVNISQPVREALHNPDADFTLFAPDDEALTPPWKRKNHSRKQGAYEPYEVDEIPDSASSHVFWDALEAIENESRGSGCPHMKHLSSQGEEQDGDKEKKKKLFLHAVELVLKYHVSPGRKTIREIIESNTLPTELRILPDSGAPRFRVRVGAALPHLEKPDRITLNFCAKLKVLKRRPILTKNGIIYVIEKVPLLPPLSPLSELFLFPRPFSTLTSALQKTHLDNILLPRWENKTIPLSMESSPDLGSPFNTSLEGVDERVQSVLSSLTGSHCHLKKKSFTIFAPTNHAFRSLGPAANAFLFSPFGARILRYVLSYHIVPDLIWNTDHCDKTKGNQTLDCDLKTKIYQAAQPPMAPFTGHPVWDQNYHPHPGKVNVTELLLPTLLGSRANESLPIVLVDFKYVGKGPHFHRSRVFIKQNKKESSILKSPSKHDIPVIIADGVAWGGALHLIPKLIHPPVPEGHHHHKDVQRALELSILTYV